MNVIASVKKAWERRALAIAQNPKGAFRVFCGEREGIPGLVVDRYCDVLVFQIYEQLHSLKNKELDQIARWYLNHTDSRSIYLKDFVRDRSHHGADGTLYEKTPFAGVPSEEKMEIQEGKARFWIRPYQGYSTGLFLDQRPNRAFLAKDMKGKKVLNGFAYTCAFSVMCALEGAYVVSVDLSSKYLEWGKENFSLNGLDPDQHEFYACDIFRYLEGAKKRNKKFDLIILDPPSFSQSPKGTFNVRRDLGDLCEAARPLLDDGGRFFFSSNLQSWSSENLEASLREHFPRASTQKLPARPEDFRWQTNPLNQVLLQV